MIVRHPFNSATAAELRGYLKAAGMTQAQLAEATGMSETVIQRYLAGTRDVRSAHMYEIGIVLGFEPRELMERTSARYARESGADE